MWFLLTLPVVSLPTSIQLSRLHDKCDEWLDERPDPFKMEHQRDRRVRRELSTYCLTDGLPCLALHCAYEECVLPIIHRVIAVATHLLVSLLIAPQIRLKIAVAWERLPQIKADFPVLPVQPGVELQNQVVGPCSGLLTMPSRLPLLNESAPSILADGLLRASDFLQVGTRPTHEPEKRHMSSLLWETICRPHISPTCRSDSHLSFATGSLEPCSALSPRCRCSISRYWTHCVCQCLKPL